jgi:ribosomal protein L11 methylase PrmA
MKLIGPRGMAHSSSFRDPSGVVLVAEGRVFRTIEESAWDQFQSVESSGLLNQLAVSGRVVATWPIKDQDAPAGLTKGLSSRRRRVVEHERIPVISYPYEWPFALLKRAALHYLDLYLELLESNFALSDASAYNVQFLGTRPVFIDILSIRPYREGEYWTGYRQFCEQFLNPLLLTSINGVPHQSWFRGSTEGIPVEEMARVLPIRASLDWRVLLHVVLHARMSAKTLDANNMSKLAAGRASDKPMPKATLAWLLRSLRKWILGLDRNGKRNSVWQRYEQHTSYDAVETEAKRAFVVQYVSRRMPEQFLDLGCNTGSYSQLALAAGARRAVAIDFDQEAIDGAIVRADTHKLDLLPLVMDAMNPSPNQGWAQREWLGFEDRINADGLLALAFLHHIVIGRNVPMAQAVAWLVQLAPSGIVEFIPKNDHMVQQMLANRTDIFDNYNIEHFRLEMSQSATIVNELVVSRSGRTLFEYQR